MFGKDIPWTDQVKYLGVLLDRRLTWVPQVRAVQQKFCAARAALFPLLCRNSCLSVDNKLLLYKMVIRPTCTYAAPVWGAIPKTAMRRLEAQQNRTVRLILDAPTYVRTKQINRDLKLPTLEECIKKLASNFHRTVADHPNATIRGLADYDESDRRRGVKRPRYLLCEYPSDA